MPRVNIARYSGRVPPNRVRKVKAGTEFYDYVIKSHSPAFVDYARNTGRPDPLGTSFEKKTEISKQLADLAGLFLLNTSSGGKKTNGAIQGTPCSPRLIRGLEACIEPLL